MTTTEPDAPAKVNRRAFLGIAGTGVGGAALVGITAAKAWPEAPVLSAEASSGAGQASTGVAAASMSMSDPEMNASSKARVDQFLKNTKTPITEGLGAQDLAFKMDGVVRVFELTCKKVTWEVAPGEKVEAVTYNGTVPGPTIRVVEGQPVRVHVKNEMDESTSVHWHGQRVPNDQDGVPYVTQPPIEPGKDYTYEFTPGPFGSHMYHSHHNAADQVGRGMLGALIVEPKDRSAEPAADKDYLYIVNDTLGGFTINGKGFPATQAYSAKMGQRVRFRFMNEGQMAHPIHLHGLTYEIFARDGYPLPQPFRCDTITVAPGERWDALVVADNPGVWAFHCHILSHAESPQGMFGMVSVLIVE